MLPTSRPMVAPPRTAAQATAPDRRLMEAGMEDPVPVVHLNVMVLQT